MKESSAILMKVKGYIITMSSNSIYLLLPSAIGFFAEKVVLRVVYNTISFDSHYLTINGKNIVSKCKS